MSICHGFHHSETSPGHLMFFLNHLNLICKGILKECIFPLLRCVFTEEYFPVGYSFFLKMV